MGVTLGVLGCGRTKRQGLREGEEDEDGAQKEGENNSKLCCTSRECKLILSVGLKQKHSIRPNATKTENCCFKSSKEQQNCSRYKGHDLYCAQDLAKAVYILFIYITDHSIRNLSMQIL